MKKFFCAITLISVCFFAPTSINASTPNYCLRVPVLMYHHIQPNQVAATKKQTSLTVDDKIFIKQMHYLSSSGYKTLTAQELATALISRGPLSPKSIVITVDDGYEDFYTYAYPTTQQLGLKVNLMISTGLINNPDYLSWDQLKTMVNSGLVIAHNHTWSHANLASATPVKREFEISTAFSQLKDNLNQDTKIFTYPYGSKNSATQTLLQTKGYIAAFSTVPGRIECSDQIMQLPRLRIGNLPLSSYGI